MLELLITLTLLSIILSIAGASWRSHLTKARRIEAITLLTQLANRQEFYRLKNRRYAEESEINSAQPAGLGLTTTDTNYLLTLTTSGHTYIASATPRAIGLQARDNECSLFSITSGGDRRAENQTGQNTTARCWPD
jgi:Tfp pilus assembly protein PilE